MRRSVAKSVGKQGGGRDTFLSSLTKNGQIECSELRGHGADVDAGPSERWEHGEHSDM